MLSPRSPPAKKQIGLLPQRTQKDAKRIKTMTIIGIPNLDKFAHLGVYSSGVFGITGRTRDGSANAPGNKASACGLLF
jgi:hypothetical protein